MTRGAILGVLVLGMASCSRGLKSTPCDQVNDRMRALERQRGRVDEALRLAGGFLDRRGADLKCACYWTLYFHRADVVLNNKGPEPAIPLIDRPIPAGFSTPELEATREMLHGKVQYRLTHFRQALRHLQAAYDRAPPSSPKLVFAIEALRAEVYDQLGDRAGAERSLKNADDLAARMGAGARLYLYGMRGRNLQQAGRFEEAVESFEKALSLAKEQDDEALTASALVNLGWCYHELGELDKARDLLDRALEINHRIHADEEEQTCLGDLGTIYLDWRDFAKAAASYLRALELARKQTDSESVSMWLSNLASVAIETRDWTAAQTYNDEALKLRAELQLKDAELNSRVNAALIANGRGDRAKAIEILTGVLQARSADPRPNIGAHAALAEIYRKTGDGLKAETEFEEALSIIDQHRKDLTNDSNKLSYGSNLTGIESSYISLLMQENKSERALEVTEARRARLLNERVGADKQHRPVTAADYRKVARDSGRVLISYSLGPERSFVWVVSPNRIEARALASEAQINRLVESYRALIEDQEDPLDSDSHLGEDLYRELIAPVSDLIRPGSRVVIVPHGSLHALNMETLIAPSPAPHYWADDVVVSVAPSLNVLAVPAKRAAQQPALLLIGDPISADPHYPKLPFAAHEIAAVQGYVPRYFDPARTLIFRGDAAVRAAYLGSHPERFSVIHFTAHGTADRESPFDSAIILSKSQGDYRLTAKDVLDAKLNADLVVISACRSAGARTYAGEGLVGFTWTFFRAGAGNVIAGLWDVTDEITPQLMDELYGALARGAAPDRALRQAKLSMLHSETRNRVPYYWASFQLYARRLI